MIKILKEIVEALETYGNKHRKTYLLEGAWEEEIIKGDAAIQAGKKLIAKLESQEPVAWMYQEYRDDDQFGWRDEIQFVQPPNDPNYFRYIVPVYTHPPQRIEQEPDGRFAQFTDGIWREVTDGSAGIPLYKEKNNG
jgi:hypothetical protein